MDRHSTRDRDLYPHTSATEYSAADMKPPWPPVIRTRLPPPLLQPPLPRGPSTSRAYPPPQVARAAELQPIQRVAESHAAIQGFLLQPTRVAVALPRLLRAASPALLDRSSVPRRLLAARLPILHAANRALLLLLAAQRAAEFALSPRVRSGDECVLSLWRRHGVAGGLVVFEICRMIQYEGAIFPNQTNINIPMFPGRGTRVSFPQLDSDNSK